MSALKDRAPSEGGLTLVECLVAVAIIGIAILGIVSALGTASLASDFHRKQVTADTVIRSYTEALKQQIHLGGYQTCPATATSYAIPTAVWQPPSGYSVSINSTSIKYLQSASGTTFSVGCAGSDQGAEQMSVTARSSDGRDTETLDLIVRAP